MSTSAYSEIRFSDIANDHSAIAAVTTPRTTIVLVAVVSVSVHIGDSAA
jgi:hypothetical protein